MTAPLLLLLSTLSHMPGDYLSTRQLIHDELPGGAVQDQALDAQGGAIRVTPLLEPAPGQLATLTLYVAYPGLEYHTQTLTDLGDGRVRVYETDPVYLGCEPTIEVAARADGYDFTVDDIRFPDGADRDTCLSLLPYPLRGSYSWRMDARTRRLALEVRGDVEDADAQVRHRTLTLEFH